MSGSVSSGRLYEGDREEDGLQGFGATRRRQEILFLYQERFLLKDGEFQWKEERLPDGPHWKEGFSVEQEYPLSFFSEMYGKSRESGLCWPT